MENLTDRELYNRCREYGGRSLHWRNKFIGLLPEVYRRRLYEKKGYSSIFEFAARLAGLSHGQVRACLNLEKRSEYLPMFRQALVEGEVSINKLARVISVVTPENEAALVAQAKILSNRAVEVLVRDFKNQNGLLEPKVWPKSLHVQTLHLSDEVTTKLLKLQSKGVDVNSLLTEFLEKRELDIAAEKEAIAAECQPTSSRYIPVRVRRVVKQEHGTVCSMSACDRPSEDLHHTQRFALAQRHDPHYLAPLCKNHHQIAHSIDVRVQEKRMEVLQC